MNHASAPGGPHAVRRGCTCDPRANHHGRGHYVTLDGRTLYRTDPSCRLHAPARTPRPQGGHPHERHPARSH